MTRAINGVGASWAYDPLGRLTSEASVLGTFAYGYVGVTGRLATVTDPNGQTSSYSYLPLAQDLRLQTIHHQRPGGPTLLKFDPSTRLRVALSLSNGDYTYDAVGNILTWQQQADSDAPTVWRFGYDAADQLTAAVRQTTDPTPVVLARYGYGYDPAGNRTFEQVNDAVTAASHDVLNRLTAHQPGGALQFEGAVSEPATVTVAGKPAAVDAGNRFQAGVPVTAGTNTVAITATDASGNVATATYEVDVTGTAKAFTYDANGNLTADGTRTFEWDAKNQIVAVTVGTHRSEFTYDGQGRRVRMVEQESGLVQTDRQCVWVSTAVAEERDAGAGAVTRRFFETGEQAGGAALFYARDHLGSVRELTDGAASLRARYAYDPWGRQTKLTGDLEAWGGFTGHPQHAASGLALTLYRGYDAAFGRWVSQDPIGLSDGPNLYAYVENRVTVWLDPLGLQKCCDQLKQRRKRLHEILDQIDSGEEPSGFGIGGATVCAGNTPDPLDTDYIRKTMGLCLSECAIVHENRHASQCRRFGAEHIGRNSRAMERSAYLVELGCIIRKIQSSKCEDCK